MLEGGSLSMLVISATIYLTMSILLGLLACIWYYFMYSYYFPLIICAIIFLVLAIISYSLYFKKNEK